MEEEIETIALSENDVARLINGEEISLEVDGKKVILRQSYMKDNAADMLVRANRVMDTVANSFAY